MPHINSSVNKIKICVYLRLWETKAGKPRELNPDSLGLSTALAHPGVPPRKHHSHLVCALSSSLHKGVPSFISLHPRWHSVILTAQTQGNCDYKLLPLSLPWAANRILLGCCFPQDWCHGNHSQNAYVTLQQHLGEASAIPEMNASPVRIWEPFKI